jgi:hypothetical protein
VPESGDPNKVSTEQLATIQSTLAAGKALQEILTTLGVSMADFQAKQAAMAGEITVVMQRTEEQTKKEIERLKKIEEHEQKKIDRWKDIKKSKEWEIAFNRQQIDQIDLKIKLALEEMKLDGKKSESVMKQIKQLEKQKELIKLRNRENEKYVVSAEQAVTAAKDLSTELGGMFQAYAKSPLFNVGNMVKFGQALSGGANSAKEAFNTLASVGLTAFVDATIGLALAMDAAESTFRRTTGASKSMAREMTGAYEATREFGVQSAQVASTMTSLHSTFTDFTMLTGTARAGIIETGAVMQQLGVSADSFAKVMQVGNKVMGQTAAGAAHTARELSSLANNLGIAPEKLIADYGQVGMQLAKLGADGTRAFKDLARVSKITGLEITKLLAITDKFDTFEGAATQAGKLNAALGGNFVNAMDLMTATDPVDRFQQIRGALEEAGLSFDDMSYYQRKFYADSLGLESVGDLALMMSGDMSALGNEMNMTSADFAEQADRAREMQSVQEKLKTVLQSLIPVFLPLLEMLQGFAEWMSKNIEFVKGFVTVMFTLLAVTKLAKIGMAAFAVIKGILTAANWALFSSETAVTAGAAPAAAASTTVAASLVTVGTAASFASVGLGVIAAVVLALGAALLMAGRGIAYVVSSIAELVVALTGFVAVLSMENIAPLIILVAALAAAGPAGILALIGFGAMALGLGALALALAFIATRDLEAIATFTEALSNTSASSLLETARAIRVVAKAMDEIPANKAVTLTTTLRRFAAVSAMMIPGGASRTGASAPTGAGAQAAGGSSAGSGGRQQVTVNLSIDGTVFETKVLDIVDGAIAVQHP